MTKEEAIARIIDHKIVHEMDEPRAIHISEALDMAIEALKQEPCEDAIDRQKAIRYVKEQCNPYGKPTIDFESGKKVIKLLKQMSPVTPTHETVTEFADRCRECGAKYGKLLEQKTGHWIKHDTGHSIYYTCSRCSCLAPCTETLDKWLWKLSNYCPDCGAKMVKSQNSEG